MVNLIYAKLLFVALNIAAFECCDISQITSRSTSSFNLFNCQADEDGISSDVCSDLVQGQILKGLFSCPLTLSKAYEAGIFKEDPVYSLEIKRILCLAAFL